MSDTNEVSEVEKKFLEGMITLVEKATDEIETVRLKLVAEAREWHAKNCPEGNVTPECEIHFMQMYSAAVQGCIIERKMKADRKNKVRNLFGLK